jgi:hypothetical protein
MFIVGCKCTALEHAWEASRSTRARINVKKRSQNYLRFLTARMTA